MVALHAVILLTILLSPVVLWRMRKSGSDGSTSPLWSRLAYVVPFLIVGGVCSLLMSVNGAPFSEWAIPAFAVLAAAFIAPTRVSLRIYSGILFAVCLGLCAEGLMLRSSGYTSNPKLTASLSTARARSALQAVRDQLERQQLPPVETPQPVSEVLDHELPSVETVQSHSEWHTFVTGLFRVERFRQIIWIVGQNGTSPQLEMRPVDDRLRT